MRYIRTVVALSLALPVLVFAQTATPHVDQREANQQARIQQGASSGSLTQREAGRLERDQMHIANMENRARADGVVTQQERARLHHAQDAESRRIYAEKHDRQHDYNHNGVVDHRRHR